jgi:hypothetical protein
VCDNNWFWIIELYLYYSLSASHSTFDIWYFFSAIMIILLSYSSVSEWIGNFMIEKKCK